MIRDIQEWNQWIVWPHFLPYSRLRQSPMINKWGNIVEILRAWI